MSRHNLGRLIRTTKDKCQGCSRNLQLREENKQGLTVQYKVCPNCGEKSEFSNDKRRRSDYKERSRIAETLGEDD